MESSTQKVHEGVGPLYHRIYAIEFRASEQQAEKAMARLQSNPNIFSPQWLAEFHKMSGRDEKLRVGDEFQIYIAGPWNGPVRVTEVTPRSFHLATLVDHMEAGEIDFRIRMVGEERARFEIESLAKSRDRLVDFVYDKIPIARLAQTTMWEKVCKAVAEEACYSSADWDDTVHIVTEKRDETTGLWQVI